MTWTIPVLLVALAVWLLSVRNGLFARRNACLGEWAQIETQLKRRRDLIPGLIEVARAFLEHERGLLDAIARARAEAARARGIPAISEAEAALAGLLGRLTTAVETWPLLKADASLAMLREDLVSTEERIARARQRYNDLAVAYNTAIQTFPGSLFAGASGLSEMQCFRVPEDADREAPRVLLR
jgi:LemA protein